MAEPVWEDGSWAGLPRLEGDFETDVCVIGLGGSGLACVGELLRLGVRVVGLDACQIAGGAAGRNGGLLLAGTAAFHHNAVRELGRERAVALYRLTLQELNRMTEETPAAVRRTGSLRVALSLEEEKDCTEQLRAMQADALPVQPYDGAEGKGLLFPEDGVFNPLLRCRLLAKKAVEEGALLFEHSPALTFSGSEVRTPQGRVLCNKVIVAVDGGLAELLPELSSKVRTARLQMLATAPTVEVSLPRPVYARYGYEYWQQLPGGSVALGGFRDVGGEGEWTSSTEVSPLIQERLTTFLREHVKVQAPVTHRWAASVGYVEGVLPLLEQPRENVWALGGYNGTGNVMGALYGRAAAQLAVTGSSSIPT